jgi:hypothetical protein
MNRWTMIGVLLASPLLVLVSKQASGAAEAPGHVLSSETDQRAVVDFLRKIIDDRNKADARAKNFQIKGRVAMVTVDWKTGMELRTAATMPNPEWRNFSLVQRGAKRRLETEYVQETGQGATLRKTLMTAYRLADGEGFYTLDGNAVEIVGNKEGQKGWESLNFGYFSFGQVHDGREYGALVDVCQTLIDRMTKGFEHDYWQRRVLRCSDDRGLLLVDNDDKVIGKSRYRYRFWVDASKGYRVTRSVNQMGGLGMGLDYRKESHVVPQEVRVCPTSPPLPCTQGRGVGGEGRESSGNPPPHPNPSPPEYRGRGASGTDS